MTFYPVNLVGNAALSNPVTVAQGGTGSTTAIGNGISGQYVVAPSSYAPATLVAFSTASATMGALTVPATTVAAGSNGGTISGIAAWGTPGAGQLAVATSTNWPPSGTVNVAASGPTTAIVTYTGISAGLLTGCVYVSGSPVGTVATGGAVTLTSLYASTGAFTAPASGNVIVTASFTANVGASVAFSVGLAAHGTVTPMVCNSFTYADATASETRLYTAVFYVTGLTGSNNFDLLSSVAGANTLTIRALGSTSTTPTGTVGGPITLTVSAV